MGNGVGYPIEKYLGSLRAEGQCRSHPLIEMPPKLPRRADAVDARLGQGRRHRKQPLGPGGRKRDPLGRQQQCRHANARQQAVKRLKAHFEHHHADDGARGRVHLIQRGGVIQATLLRVGANGRVHTHPALNGLLKIGPVGQVDTGRARPSGLMRHHGTVGRHDVHALHQKPLAGHAQTGQGLGVVRRDHAPRHVFEQRLAQPQQRHGAQHARAHGLRVQ